MRYYVSKFVGMKENTNSIIAINSLLLYARMFITSICALLTTRFALQALGVVDYGLFSVLGGLISFIGIFNTIMLSTSNRFLAVAIGRGDVDNINKVFNVNLLIFFAIAIITLLVCFPIGNWYIYKFINYEGQINNAIIVFTISIIGAVISAIGIPYNGLLMAKERFFVFCIIDVISHIIRLFVSYLLIFYFDQKLVIYTATLAITTALPTFVYYVYCRKVYFEFVKFRLITDRKLYKDVFSFSGWVGIGAVAMICKNQGASLLVNAFFNTIMNTALGIANSIIAYIQMFSNNVVQPMMPQITKAYAAGNLERTNELLVMSTKMSFMMMFLVSSPFLVCPEWIISIWLGYVPQYSVSFLILLIVDSLIQSLNSGVSNIIFASGKVRGFQICVSILNISSIIIAYIALNFGYAVYVLFFVYIVISCIKLFVIQYILHRTINYNNSLLVRDSYIPSVIIILLFIPMLFFPLTIHPIIKILISVIYLALIEFMIGFNKNERGKVVNKTIKKIIRDKYEGD